LAALSSYITSEVTGFSLFSITKKPKKRQSDSTSSR
jgi:hypothetical protein